MDPAPQAVTKNSEVEQNTGSAALLYCWPVSPAPLTDLSCWLLVIPASLITNLLISAVILLLLLASRFHCASCCYCCHGPAKAGFNPIVPTPKAQKPNLQAPSPKPYPSALAEPHLNDSNTDRCCYAVLVQPPSVWAVQRDRYCRVALQSNMIDIIRVLKEQNSSRTNAGIQNARRMVVESEEGH